MRNSSVQFKSELRRRQTEEVQSSQKWSCKFVITVVITVNIQINHDQIQSQHLFTAAETLTQQYVQELLKWNLFTAQLLNMASDRQSHSWAHMMPQVKNKLCN
jgi:hypothetical protein